MALYNIKEVFVKDLKKNQSRYMCRVLVSGLALKNDSFQFNLTYSFLRTLCVYRTCCKLRACLQ